MKISTTYLSVLLGVLVLSGSSCRDRGPDPPPPPPPGKENFTWTVDTIALPGSIQTMLGKFCAFSATDIFVAGHNATNRGKIYHFDGVKWSMFWIDLRKSFDLTAIMGSSLSDLWVVGEQYEPILDSERALIAHFNGRDWAIDSTTGGRLNNCISGIDGKPVLAGGIGGYAFKYIDGQWQPILAPSHYWFSDFLVHANDTFALAYSPYRSDSEPWRHYFLRYHLGNFAIIDSVADVGGAIPSFGHAKLQNVGEDLYSVGIGVYKWDGQAWKKVLATEDGVELYSMFGTRLGHIFVIGYPEAVYHFNGERWSKVALPDSLTPILSDVWCTEDEVFVLGYDGAQSYVYHGK